MRAATAAPAPAADDPLGLGAMDLPRLLALREVLAGAEAALSAAEAGLAVSIHEDAEGFYAVMAVDVLPIRPGAIVDFGPGADDAVIDAGRGGA